MIELHWNSWVKYKSDVVFSTNINCIEQIHTNSKKRLQLFIIWSQYEYNHYLNGVE